MLRNLLIVERLFFFGMANHAIPFGPHAILEVYGIDGVLDVTRLAGVGGKVEVEVASFTNLGGSTVVQREEVLKSGLQLPSPEDKF